MIGKKLWYSLLGFAAVVALMAAVACKQQSNSGGLSADVQKIIKERGLKPEDITAALKTYVPTGKKDKYVMFASGGHSGQVVVIGVPSMRILKYIGVFTPEPWQGYGFDNDSKEMLKNSSPKGKLLTWGDVHHPSLSETNGIYDGEYLFVNDKANARIAVVSLKDFTTIQIVRSGLMRSDHGATFVTPNTEYVVEASQYPIPLDGSYAPIGKYNDKYRGLVIFWKFDRTKGRIDIKNSFAIELPPYMQDLSDAGKGPSYGWVFINSLNTERATGGILQGKDPLEKGSAQHDMDYLHLINWKKAEQVLKNKDNYKVVQSDSLSMRVIPMETAVKEGLLYFIPEPKSPHGVDVTPDGKYICVSGKLDTHETVYSWEKIQKAIKEKNFQGKDPYGIPILKFKATIKGQVNLGLGPLHTQFDGKGYAYTSLYIESAVAKWSVKDLKVVEKIKVHYNIGHLAVTEGDTAQPDGKFLVAMNKWALDRFLKIGPLLPQNFQLIDLTGKKMQLIYDMPIPLGEPHYAQIIKAERIKALEVYPKGFNNILGKKDPYAIEDTKQARIERKEDGVHVYIALVRSHITPDIIEVNEGDTVHLHVTSIEQAYDATHGFAISDYNINLSVEPGRTVNVTFKADKPGTFPFYCTEFCSALHLEMAGYFLVKPKEEKEKK